VPDAVVATDLDLWARFTAKAEAVGATVTRVADEAAAAEMVARAESPACSSALAEVFPMVAARCQPLGKVGSISAEVVTRGLFGVAETGSVLTAETNPERGACMLAEQLWLLVPAGEIVPTLDLAFDRLGELIRAGRPYLTFMTGPSRSADIERTLTIGVHGPRALTIVVVGGVA
jgi:L-lactate dehydrogenase complex protein LldG